MSHHILEAKDLSYTYPDRSQGIKGVSFCITHGESVAIMGSNGVGKSTLLLHLNGYLISTRRTLRIGDDISSLPIADKTISSSHGIGD